MSKNTKQTSKAKAVYNIVENGEYTNWNKVGVAFVNKDGSYNVVLDALPVNGKLHIRDFKPKADTVEA